MPVDNFDEIAVSGACVVLGPQDLRAPLSEWVSAPLTNPTWEDVARVVNQMLIESNEKRFIHFEGIEWIAPHEAPIKRITVCLVD